MEAQPLRRGWRERECCAREGGERRLSRRGRERGGGTGEGGGREPQTAVAERVARGGQRLQHWRRRERDGSTGEGGEREAAVWRGQ